MRGAHSSLPISTTDPRAAITELFERFGRCCAASDYASAEALFAPDVVSFGTKAAIVSDRERLRREQWEGIWPNIEGFRFDVDQLRAGGDERWAWGMVPWTSIGFDERGNAFNRPGRATMVMENRDGAWLVVHTHFSLVPGTPARTERPID